MSSLAYRDHGDDPPLHELRDYGDGHYECICPDCCEFVDLNSALLTQQVTYLTGELACHQRLLGDLGDRAALLAANHDNAGLTVATFQIFAASAFLVRAVRSIRRVEVQR